MALKFWKIGHTLQSGEAELSMLGPVLLDRHFLMLDICEDDKVSRDRGPSHRQGNALYKSGLFQEAVQAYTLGLTKLASTEVLKHATLLCNRAAAHLRCPGADAASSCAEDAEAALVMLAELPQEDVRLVLSCSSLVQKAEWRLQRARELMDIRRLHAEAQEDPATVGEVRLVLHKVLESIGGRLWDASLLQASWLAEHRRKLPQATGAGLKLLEVGAGLGLLGLTAQKLLPEAQVVMTDYDPAVLAAIETNIAANFREDERKPTTGRLDFRDFTSAALEASGGEPPGGTLKELVETGQLGSFHLVLGSDVVYDSYHGRQLALVISAMLLPQRDHQGPAPCAVFLLPDSRPRLASFVQALPSAGLSCRIESYSAAFGAAGRR
ncbi:unnamed protein product [Symbiodinium sp. KB8]|nr:unnamed protein product [Symbiodinium sp. KB8]